MRQLSNQIVWSVVAITLCQTVIVVAESPEAAGDPEKGYRLLVDRPYLPPYFDQETFDNVWRVWPEPLKSRAAEASPEVRREMAYARYGLTPRPDDPEKPLQYVVDAKQNWTLNCFACHGGKVAGEVVPGLPNSHFAFATITDDIRNAKLLLGKPLRGTDYSSIGFPLGDSNGTTNAVNFGVALMALRDADLNIQDQPAFPPMVHHDLDAPPWWHFHKKEHIYLDGFAPKGHRGLMQFTMVPQNGPEKFRQREDDFRHIYAYLDSLRPPEYPFEIDQPLARQGKLVFEKNCSRCHGTYGDDADYPETPVAMQEIGTDRARFDALRPEYRQHYLDSWFNEYGETGKGTADPEGYVAPPLDGIWASAPYLHNGSVPTLWHLLHPEQRPVVWKRSVEGYDRQKVGLEAETWETLPPAANSRAERRTYFDTGRPGKSARGHDFPGKLTIPEREAVLEYLKTL